MKTLYLIFVLLSSALTLSAQTGYNYYRYALGFGSNVGFVQASTNLQKQYSHAAYNVNFSYSFNPYFHITTEVQTGTFSGGEPGITQDPLGPSYVNHFGALVVSVDLQLGSLVDYQDNGILNFLKGFYFKTGAGALYNNNTVQYRKPPTIAIKTEVPGIVITQRNSSGNAIAPSGIGYEFKLYNGYDEPAWALSLASTYYVVFGQGIDGRSSSIYNPGEKGNFGFIQTSLGIKYFFLGRIHSYKKAIKGFYKNK